MSDALRVGIAPPSDGNWLGWMIGCCGISESTRPPRNTRHRSGSGKTKFRGRDWISRRTLASAGPRNWELGFGLGGLGSGHWAAGRLERSGSAAAESADVGIGHEGAPELRRKAAAGHTVHSRIVVIAHPDPATRSALQPRNQASRKFWLVPVFRRSADQTGLPCRFRTRPPRPAYR